MQLFTHPTNSNLVLNLDMSLTLIHQYYNEKFKLKNVAKQDSESVLRRAFARLLEGFAQKKNLLLIEEFSHKTVLNTTIRFDGVLKNEMGLDFGYWEAKAKVDLEDEIRKKFNKGYPKSNILFEDGIRAVLYQDGQRVLAIDIADENALNDLLQQFFAFETPELRDFHEAVLNFKKDVPDIATALRKMIDTQQIENQGFKQAQARFLQICQEAINPEIQAEDVNEMLIQHILTEQIFIAVFSDDQLIRENNIARELYLVEATFFKGNVKRNVLDKIKNYYEVIAIAAKQLHAHHEKQFFLKKVYENFYKAYNPKGADKLGIVYTPSEMVHFQIKATEYLLEKHFGKTLSHKGVEILDPATGTGTYICELIEHISPHALKHKFLNEIYANEIAILPYYIANLNIEYTFRNKMQSYESFPNLCFVDTLDNIGGLGWKGKQMDMFGLSAENAERIKRQNDRKISVIIGNPPYNARQTNFNDDNKNRLYKEMDRRIKETFIKNGTAQNQIVVYDMYIRFYRWALDRLNQDGIVCFITNNSFIDGRAFDGFRKSIQQECSYAYILDLGGDIRKLSGKDGIFLNEQHTIFGMAAAVGISIMFLVKKANHKLPCQILYLHPCDIRATRAQKFEFLQDTPFEKMLYLFEEVVPDKKGNWINLTDNDFDTLLPLIDKNVKAGKENNAIFKTFCLGIDTHKDEWVYDFSKNNLTNKIKFFKNTFNETLNNKSVEQQKIISWTRELVKVQKKNKPLVFDESKIVTSLYRPFAKRFYYFDKDLTSYVFNFETFCKNNEKNIIIAFNVQGNNKPFHCLASNTLLDLHTTGDSQCLPLFVYNKNGEKQDNITDWALTQFRQHYDNQAITKEVVFYYVYAVLHAPAYRTAYEQNLKRDFPRIPFYENVDFYAEQGRKLADLHLHYENAAPYNLRRVDNPPKVVAGVNFVPKAKLKADKANHCIEIDEITKLCNVPAVAWEYKLGNRSALEWILDQYKESKPTDKTIAMQFNTYRFADYKEKVIELLQSVCRVSVETMALINGL
jgi:predicted helicase